MTSQDRLAATWALLRSYADWMPGARTSTGSIVQRSTSGGEVASAYDDCPTCGGRGTTRRSGQDVPCRTCAGRGAIAVDAYTRREVEPERRETFAVPTPDELARSIRFRRVRCDVCGGSGRVSASSVKDPGLRDMLELDGEHRHWWRQAERERCAPCRGSGSVEVVDERMTDASLRRIAADEAARAGAAVSADWLSSALERRRAQWQHGSYGDLALALRRLELRAPRLHAALLRHVVYEPGEYVVSDDLRRRIEQAVGRLAGELPDPIRVPAEAKLAHTRKHVLWRHRSEAASMRRERRDAEIAALVLDHGQAPEHVAEIHGVTPRRVRQIVASAVSVTAVSVTATAGEPIRYGRVRRRLFDDDEDVVVGGVGEWDQFKGRRDDDDERPVAVATFAL